MVTVAMVTVAMVTVMHLLTAYHCLLVHLQDHLVREGMAWVDDQGQDGERLYWFPGIFEN